MESESLTASACNERTICRLLTFFGFKQCIKKWSGRNRWSEWSGMRHSWRDWWGQKFIQTSWCWNSTRKHRDSDQSRTTACNLKSWNSRRCNYCVAPEHTWSLTFIVVRLTQCGRGVKRIFRSARSNARKSVSCSRGTVAYLAVGLDSLKSNYHTRVFRSKYPKYRKRAWFT